MTHDPASSAPREEAPDEETSAEETRPVEGEAAAEAVEQPRPLEIPAVEAAGPERSSFMEPSRAAEPPHRETIPTAMGPELEPIELDELAPEVVAPPSDRRRGPRFNFLTGTLVLSSIALLGGYLVVNLVLMPSLTRQGVEVRVPEVIGLSEREAERLLAGEDLKLSKISEQWSPDVPRGFITAQDPAAGGVVKRGRRISVIVSLGAQGTSVPVLEGVTARQAEIMLEGAGLKLGRYARAYSDQVSKDMVIATDPPGETVVEQETAVDLLVSMGPAPRSFVLPDLEGRDASSAARNLRDEGFSVSLREGGGRQKSGLVAGQEPPAGHRVAPRDSIVLYYHP
jgi:eukaryotic-like serine/threonine-protein kinase